MPVPSASPLLSTSLWEVAVPWTVVVGYCPVCRGSYPTTPTPWCTVFRHVQFYDNDGCCLACVKCEINVPNFFLRFFSIFCPRICFQFFLLVFTVFLSSPKFLQFLFHPLSSKYSTMSNFFNMLPTFSHSFFHDFFPKPCFLSSPTLFFLSIFSQPRFCHFHLFFAQLCFIFP